MSFDPVKALTHRVILLSGDEEVRRRRALEAILATAGVQKDDFDVESTAGDTTPPIQWIAACSTSPFMGDRRITIVRRLLRCDPDKGSTFDLGTLPSSALLILVADEEGGTDDKMSRFATISKNWTKLVQRAKGLVLEFKADPKTVRAEIKAEVAASGKSMTDRALDTLVEMTGSSLGRALDELEKLVVFAGNQSQITESDVRRVVVPSREWNAFRMVDAIVAGAPPEALHQLEALVGSASKAEEAAFSRILPLVGRQLRLLWQARVCLEAGCHSDHPTAEVLAMFPEKPNLANESPYRRSSLTQLARRTTLPRLRRGFEILSDTDARLKGALESFTAIDTLERMVLDMSVAIKA